MLANPILLQMKYARVVSLFAKLVNISLYDALEFFYNSHTYYLMSNGIADFHCEGDEYLAENLQIEYGKKA